MHAFSSALVSVEADAHVLATSSTILAPSNRRVEVPFCRLHPGKSGGEARPGPAGRRDGQREAVHRQKHTRDRRPDGRMQAALPQDGAPLARQGREQINERQRRQDAGLPPLHGSGLQVRVEEDRAPHAHALVAERRDKAKAV